MVEKERSIAETSPPAATWLPIKNIEKELKVNWRTLKKYAEREDWNVEVKEKTYPVLGNYLDVIDLWLAVDSCRRNRKQHHTNLRIFHRLRDECGYKEGERTVTTYVAKKSYPSFLRATQFALVLNCV